MILPSMLFFIYLPDLINVMCTQKTKLQTVSRSKRKNNSSDYSNLTTMTRVYDNRSSYVYQSFSVGFSSIIEEY